MWPKIKHRNCSPLVFEHLQIFFAALTNVTMLWPWEQDSRAYITFVLLAYWILDILHSAVKLLNICHVTPCCIVIVFDVNSPGIDILHSAVKLLNICHVTPCCIVIVFDVNSPGIDILHSAVKLLNICHVTPCCIVIVFDVNSPGIIWTTLEQIISSNENATYSCMCFNFFHNFTHVWYQISEVILFVQEFDTCPNHSKMVSIPRKFNTIVHR